jgi:GNAT superfamily N-acetyltransferase
MIEISSVLSSIHELESLLVEANQSPFIGDIQLAEILAMKKTDTLRFIYSDDRLAGFGAWIPINAHWDEFGPFYVSERFRGQGLGDQIIQTLLVLCERRKTNLYAVTRNPAMKHILQKQGFQQVGLRTLPISVQLFALSKLNPRKVIRFLQKPHPENVSHFVYLTASG